MANRAQLLSMPSRRILPNSLGVQEFCYRNRAPSTLTRALKWNTWETYKNHNLLLCVLNWLLTVVSSALNLLLCFLSNQLWLVVLDRFTCPFTAWQFELCSSPGTDIGAEAAELLLMARTEGRCLSIRGNLNKEVVILWLKLVLGNRKWCPLRDFTASGLLGLFAVNLNPKFI